MPSYEDPATTAKFESGKADRGVDEFLPMFDGHDFSHPMCTPPRSDQHLPAHIHALRLQIANRTKFLDGKRDYGPTMKYLAVLYERSIGCPGFLGMLGYIEWEAIKATDAIDDRLAANPDMPLRHQRLLRSNRGTIESYARQLSRLMVIDIPRS